MFLSYTNVILHSDGMQAAVDAGFFAVESPVSKALLSSTNRQFFNQTLDICFTNGYLYKQLQKDDLKLLSRQK